MPITRHPPFAFAKLAKSRERDTLARRRSSPLGTCHIVKVSLKSHKSVSTFSQDTLLPTKSRQNESLVIRFSRSARLPISLRISRRESLRNEKYVEASSMVSHV